MFKFQEESVAILGICTDTPASGKNGHGLDFHAAHSGQRGIDMLRMLSFDFLLVGANLPDMALWDFLRHLRTAWPHQKWALVGGPVSDQQEIAARMYGATTLFDCTPSAEELINLTIRLRQRAAARVLEGMEKAPANATGVKAAM